jgi:hypothetical protein
VQCEEQVSAGDRSRIDCEACGLYEITGTALADQFPDRGSTWTAAQRAALSHQVRIAARNDGNPPLLKSDWLAVFRRDARLPTPAEQVKNLIRAVGDYLSSNGEGYPIDPSIDASLVGSFNSKMFVELVNELTTKGILTRLGEGQIQTRKSAGRAVRQLTGLSLDGWERYEAERRGEFGGNYGFLALKFGMTDLDEFIDSHLKPIVKANLGYDVVDMRDVARAGIIDDLMREQIRDSAFILADLTHDNPGAYWEAGYAKGLGKPVIYICERGKFEDAQTHFDTNHCTTVLWSRDSPQEFGEQFVATLRRSLNLFPSGSAG